jgi:flavin reductase (DIM6/NTAB) family NADH-FMN oxidoreductase RutF
MTPITLVGADDDDHRRRIVWALPTVLAVLGTVDDSDHPHLMNISWVTPVGNDPTRLVASVEVASKSAGNLRATSAWALSMLRVEQRDMGRAFVKPDLAYHREGDGEFLHDHAVTRSTRRAPVLGVTVAAMAGSAEHVRTLGDHDVFLLEVEEIGAHPDLLAGPASSHSVDVLRVQDTRMNYGK